MNSGAIKERKLHIPGALAALVLTSLVGAETWTQIDSETFEGDFQRRYGPWAHFSRGEASFLRLVRQLAEADQARIENLTTAIEARIEQDWGASESTMAMALEGRLFYLEGDEKRRFSFEEKEEPEFYVLYYSAGWCAPCKKFTPALVNTYKQLRDEGISNFEVFFVSGDGRRPAQFLYMRDEEMTWPAIDLNRLRGMEIINELKGRAIPCLVIVDREGHILSHTFQGNKYVGPVPVLTFLQDLLYWTNPDHAGLAIYRFGRVCERVLADPPEAVQPVPFFVSLGALKDDEEALGPLLVKLSVTKGGQVEAVGLPTDLDGARQAELEAIIKTWLFLPRVEGGEVVPCEMEGTIGEFSAWAKTTQQRF